MKNTNTQHVVPPIAELRDALFELSAETAALAKTHHWTKAMYDECLVCWIGDAVKRDMADQLKQRRAGYLPTTAYSGKPSLNNGDEVALLLAGLTPQEVCTLAERICLLPAGELWTRYENLNVGQQRMNAGNRVRGAIKRGEVAAADLPSFLQKQAI